eukprot:scaffold29229_cov27-Phaeocystis_antarctica.AAC.1
MGGGGLGPRECGRVAACALRPARVAGVAEPTRPGACAASGGAPTAGAGRCVCWGGGCPPCARVDGVLEEAWHEDVRVYFVVLVVFHGVLGAPFNGGVYYFGCVPAGGGGGIRFLPPHGDFVPTPERVGVLWG